MLAGLISNPGNVRQDQIIVAAIVVTVLVWLIINVKLYGWPPIKWPWLSWLKWWD